MKSHLALIGLAPILIVQGRYVRRVTPRLPEAEGLREGVSGNGAPLRLLILGDSAAAGVGVATQSEALAGQLVSALSPYFRVSWKLIATTGFKAEDILKQLECEPSEHFDVAVTSTGVNDVTARTSLSKWRLHQRQLVNLLISKFKTKHILLSSVPPMQVFPALPQPLSWYLGLNAQRLNVALRDFAANHTSCEFVSVGFPLEPELMASDGFHPNAEAYALWASQLAEIIRRRLGVQVSA